MIHLHTKIALPKAIYRLHAAAKLLFQPTFYKNNYRNKNCIHLEDPLCCTTSGPSQSGASVAPTSQIRVLVMLLLPIVGK
jgi:hypothetical protein